MKSQLQNLKFNQTKSLKVFLRIINEKFYTKAFWIFNLKFKIFNLKKIKD